jgi:UDP-N-acetylmuramyl pentapeptide phosphotransferase/UDP-N-acetylglucosamine-1-phosphate transferase
MLPEAVTSLFANPYLLSVLAAVLAYWVSVRMYPAIIYLSREKNLMDEPGERSAHTTRVPTYGGVGIFIAYTILSMTFCTLMQCPPEVLSRLLALMAGVSILFFLGIKDDMIGLDPRKKFGGQVLATALVILAGGVRIISLDGIFGVGELPYLASVLFTGFVFLLVVNAYNLIDGIDGLAGSIALIACLTFGGFFLANDHPSWAVQSFLLAGALMGFLRFNLSGSQRLFMGDSGSLFVGFVLAYQAVLFLNANQASPGGPVVPNAPVLVLCVLSLPLLDTLRVFILRAARGKSPFTADRNHIHHHLLDMGLDHKQASALLCLKTLLVIAAGYMLQDFAINTHLALMVTLGSCVYLGPLGYKAWQEKNRAAAPPKSLLPPKKPETHAMVRPPYQAKERTQGLRKAATVGD